MTYYFLIPVFNESANLERLSGNLRNVLINEDKYYLFIDDHSSDDTVSKLMSLFSPKSSLVITKEKNTGPGDSFNRGFEWILEHSHDDQDVIVTLEADNTSDITILPEMIGFLSQNYNLVLASVYAEGGGFDKSSLLRRIISFIANKMLRLLFNTKILTLSSFYRVYKITLVRDIRKNFNHIISENGFVCMFEILLKAIRLDAAVKEVPMVLNSRNRADKSKMKVLKTMFQYVRYILKLIFKGLN
jgi:dolichol-phosphate mannosyltransferase